MGVLWEGGGGKGLKGRGVRKVGRGDEREKGKKEENVRTGKIVLILCVGV